MQNNQISVNKYLSIAIGVAEASGAIIRKVYESGELKEKDKGGDDPVTIADLTVQRTI
jgi:fructose-1,6-bisphosphatase/inositol monophosphatase family enzyme